MRSCAGWLQALSSFKVARGNVQPTIGLERSRLALCPLTRSEGKRQGFLLTCCVRQSLASQKPIELYVARCCVLVVDTAEEERGGGVFATAEEAQDARPDKLA